MTPDKAVEQAMYALTDPRNHLLDYEEQVFHGETPDSMEASLVLDRLMFIPKPKFKVGNIVSIPSGYSNGFTVYSRVYSPDKNMWFYSPNYEDNNSSMFLRLPELPAPEECFEESELELVEKGR